MVNPHAFDVGRFFAALDARRVADGLSWSALAREMWALSADLDARRGGGHPLAASTIRNMGRRGDTSCQHAAIFLRWLERPPEDFIAEPRPGTARVPLPEPGPAFSLRWDLLALYTALDDLRVQRGATWVQVGERLHTAPNRLTALRTAKYATAVRLAMRVTQALGRPAADFVRPAEW